MPLTDRIERISARRASSDILQLDALLSESEIAVRDRVRDFVDARIRPNIADWFERAHFPVELAQELGSMGLLGLHLDGYGCPGGTAVEYGLAGMELEAGDSGLRTFVSVQGSLAMSAIHKFGSEEQKQHWLPRMASGEVIGCFGLTEPSAGSDPKSMQTRAVRDGEGWILNGSKRWIGLANLAGVAVIWAMTDEGVRGFAVPTDTPGFSTRVIDQKLSMRASVQCEIDMTDVRLGEEHRLPDAIGLKAPLQCLNEARYGISWGVIGAARDSYEQALDYAIERRQFDRPIAGFQLTQAKLTDMAVELHKGQLLSLHLGRLKDGAGLRPEQVSFGKLNNTREALEICRTSRTILGGNGISLEYPVIRHMVNLESVLTYEGTPEMHQLILGQAFTGESAFR